MQKESLKSEQNRTTQRLSAPTSTSQGFYPPLSSAALKRSLWISGGASALGALFFTAIQGTIFNFFLEDLALKSKLGFFMGISCLAGLGSLAGSWVQERYGCRKGLFLWGIGGSRLVWLLIGAIPLLWPGWKGASLQWPLAGLILFFVVTHAMGANAWLSWMGDLVPAEWQGRFWGLRQVGTSFTSAMGQFAFGWFLDLHHHPQGYLVLFAAAVFVGVIDPLLFLGVEHRPPKRAPRENRWLSELAASLAAPGMRRLLGVYVLWTVSNCVMGPNIFRFLRSHVELGVYQISVSQMMAMITFATFSFLWGRFADSHGQRGPLVVCLLLHAFCPIYYFFAGPGDWHLVTLGFVQGSLGFCGVFLFMWPMLINFTTRKGRGRAVGLAAFSAVLGLSNFLVFWLTDDVIRPGVAWLTGASVLDSTPVFLTLFACSMTLRVGAVGLAWSLPAREEETPPGRVIRMFAMTNPLRAAMHLIRYVAVGSRRGEQGPFASLPVMTQPAAALPAACGAPRPAAHDSARAAAPLHSPEESEG